MHNVTKEINNKHKNKLIPFIPEGDFYFTKGVEAFKKRKFDLALKWMTKAIEFAPTEPLYLCQTSVIYTEIGSYHKANQLLTNVLQTSGGDYVDCYYLLANNYAHLGLLNDAKKYVEYYLAKEPDGDFSEEAISLLEIIEYDDDDEEWGPPLEDEDELLIYQETAFHHLERQEWEQAIEILEEMKVLFPEHQLVNHGYAYALIHFGDQDEAIHLEEKLLEASPFNLNSRTNLALFYFEMGELEAYETHFRALLNVYPIHEQQKLRVARMMAQTGAYEEAYRRFLLLDKSMVKGHISYYQGYSIAAYYSGKEEQALTIWQEGCKQHRELNVNQLPWN